MTVEAAKLPANWFAHAAPGTVCVIPIPVVSVLSGTGVGVNNLFPLSRL